MESRNHGLRTPIHGVFSTKKPICFAVFDGMGGQELGEEAAFLAADTLKRMSPEGQGAESFLLEYCQEANRRIFQMSNHYRRGMPGTTAVLLSFSGEQASLCNIGDSKAFCLRDDTFLQLSVDHVERRMPQRAGPERKPRLTQNLGIDPEELRITPFAKTMDIRPGDVYLLCSDGLTDMVPEREIRTVIETRATVREATKTLVDKALSGGGRDNITVLLCRVI